MAGLELAYEGIDSLTGVMRRRVGLAAVRREMDRAERTGEPLVLAFVDTVGLKPSITRKAMPRATERFKMSLDASRAICVRMTS